MNVHGNSSHTTLLLCQIVADHRNAPANTPAYLRVMFAVADIDEAFEKLSKCGAQLVGEARWVPTFGSYGTPTYTRISLALERLEIFFIHWQARDFDAY
ncbi:MAG TPA: hypothetical protein VFW30_06810 [Bryocella sp.]|nr:hypothetical protein [Bryocella sp.]